MPPSDLVRLRHMLDASREAAAFSSGKAREDLKRDRVLMLAAVRCIEIIGEAASRIGPEVRLQYAQIPWTDIVAMRNRLIHAYFDIDTDLVCETLIVDLPRLIRDLEEILDVGAS
jgi:uncharacterized protein with HEPN domain